MPMDGITLGAIADELSRELKDGKIDKIQQPRPFAHDGARAARVVIGFLIPADAAVESTHPAAHLAALRLVQLLQDPRPASAC